MNLFLHAGAHKTASSFLQSALKDNHNYLLENGLKVVMRKNVINSPLQEALCQIKQDGAVDKSRADAAQESLVKMLPKRSSTDCLITNEDLFCNLKLQEFYPNLKQQLEFIASSVPEGVTPKIVLYIRRQADYVESVYMQYIHLGRSLSFESYLGGELPSFLSWLNVVNVANEVFGENNVVIKPFETIKDVGAKGFYFDFLSELGFGFLESLPYKEEIATERGANRSYSALGMEIAKMVNPILEKNEDKNKLRSFLQSNFSTATHPKASFLTEEQRKNIFEIYQSENKILFEKLSLESLGSKLGYY